MRSNVRFIAALAIIGVAAIAALIIASGQIAGLNQPQDNPELIRLYAEDQADRMPADGAEIDPEYVAARDREREQRVKELYTAGELRTGADYYHAAMVLQHALMPEDHLLAHELSIVAISKGEQNAKWLAAATEDRFLINIGRPQRFGTQTGGEPAQIPPIEPDVTDDLRRQLNVPPLTDAHKAVLTRP